MESSGFEALSPYQQLVAKESYSLIEEQLRYFKDRPLPHGPNLRWFPYSFSCSTEIGGDVISIHDPKYYLEDIALKPLRIKIQQQGYLLDVLPGVLDIPVHLVGSLSSDDASYSYYQIGSQAAAFIIKDPEIEYESEMIDTPSELLGFVTTAIERLHDLKGECAVDPLDTEAEALQMIMTNPVPVAAAKILDIPEINSGPRRLLRMVTGHAVCNCVD